MSADKPWLETPLGQRLLAAERELMSGVLEGLFGEYCVQLGAWGEPERFVAMARTQRAAVIGLPGDSGVGAYALPERLPLASDSVDVLLLPHTLDYCEQPHAALREASRVLRSDGQLVLLGFKPGGLWGLKRILPGQDCPTGTRRLVGPRNLTDWLELLDLRIIESRRYFFRWPRVTNGQAVSATWESFGKRFWPELGACYLLRSQKRMRTLTPVRQLWKRPAKVVTGLVEPSARMNRADWPRRRQVVPIRRDDWSGT